MHWRAFMVFAWGLGVGLLGADPALDGPLPSARLTLGIPATQGAPLTTDVYFPGTTNALTPAAGRCPVIVLGHGFSQSKGQHVNQGRHLAALGYIVLIPNSNPATDHSRFAGDLRKCIDWIEVRDKDTNSLFFGRAADGTHLYVYNDGPAQRGSAPGFPHGRRTSLRYKTKPPGGAWSAEKTFFDAGIKNSCPTLIEVAPGDFRAVWDSGTAETARTFISFGKLTLKA
jgi:hypothetical protein